MARYNKKMATLFKEINLSVKKLTIFDYVVFNMPFKIKDNKKKKNVFFFKYSIFPEEFLNLYINACSLHINNFYHTRFDRKKRYAVIMGHYNPYEYYFSYNFFVKNFLQKNTDNFKIYFKIDNNKNLFEFENTSYKKLYDLFDLIENKSLISFSSNFFKNLYILFLYVEKNVSKFIVHNQFKKKTESF